MCVADSESLRARFFAYEVPRLLAGSGCDAGEDVVPKRASKPEGLEPTQQTAGQDLPVQSQYQRPILHGCILNAAIMLGDT